MRWALEKARLPCIGFKSELKFWHFWVTAHLDQLRKLRFRFRSEVELKQFEMILFSSTGLLTWVCAVRKLKISSRVIFSNISHTFALSRRLKCRWMANKAHWKASEKMHFKLCNSFHLHHCSLFKCNMNSIVAWHATYFSIHILPFIVHR